MDFMMTERWKEIDGYEGVYLVSTAGRIKTKTREVIRKNGAPMTYRSKILKPTPKDNGYLTVMLYREGESTRLHVHRIVAEHFIPNPENKPEVNHKDLDKSNNRVDNLEWATTSENKKHAYDAGALHNPILKGEENGNSKLSREDVIYIYKNKNVIPNQELADKYGVHVSTIERINSGKSWSHVTERIMQSQRNGDRK